MISPELSTKIAQAKSQKQKIILATGVFDLLHSEHQMFLQKAKAAGDLLIVGIESDVRVKQIKGPSRPVNPQAKRMSAIQALPYVDEVFILPENFSKPEDHERLIDSIRPDFLAVSSHTNHLDAKKHILQKFGGDVKIVHDFNPAISTTQILEAKAVNQLIALRQAQGLR